MNEKICTKCQKSWPTTAFYRGKQWKDGLHPWCKTCFNAEQKVRYEEKCVENPPHHRWNRDSVHHSYFTEVTLPMQAYILGVLAADGNVIESVPRVSIELSTKDYDLLEIIRDELAPNHIIRLRSRKESTRFGSGESGTLAFTSQQMVVDLARFGIVPKKSALVRWPSLLQPHLASAFLLGYFDGDGSITWTINNGHSYPKWVLTSGSADFLRDVISIVKEHLGIVIGGPYSRSNTQTQTLCVTGKKFFSSMSGYMPVG